MPRYAHLKEIASSQGLAVVQESPARHSMVIAGTVAQFNRGFGVDLERYEHEGASYRGRKGQVHLPDELKDRVEGVFGLDDRQQARPHFPSSL
jgi:kumamolisin